MQNIRNIFFHGVQVDLPIEEDDIIPLTPQFEIHDIVFELPNIPEPATPLFNEPEFIGDDDVPLTPILGDEENDQAPPELFDRAFIEELFAVFDFEI